MFRRYWVAVFALGLTFSAPALSQPSDQQARPYEAQDESAAPADKGGINPASQTFPYITQEMDEGSGSDTNQGDTKHERRDTPWSGEWLLLGDNPAQATMAWASIIAGLAAFVAAVLLWLTLRETRLIGQAQARAYVSCTGGEYAIFKSGGIDIRFDLKNNGQSPAKNCTVSVRALLPEIIRDENGERIPATPIYSEWAKSKPVNVYMARDESPYCAIRSVPDEQSGRLHDGTDLLRCEAIIEWTDVFRKTQRERIFIIAKDEWYWNNDSPRSRAGKIEIRSDPYE